MKNLKTTICSALQLLTVIISSIAFILVYCTKQNCIGDKALLEHATFFKLPEAPAQELGFAYVDDVGVKWVPIITEYGLKRKRCDAK